MGEITCHKPRMPLHVLNLSAMQETQVQSLGQEDPLEEGMKTKPTPVLLPGEFHGQRSLVGYQFMGSQRVGHY